MCDACRPRGGWSRRQVLAATGGAAVGLVLPAAPVRAGPPIEILPRATWAGDVAPAGAVPDEPDVRFLLVHHTVHPNDYGTGDVTALLRDVHSFHTGRGWRDIAYNFVVDRFGRVWETRAGSLERPVAGDATGGNQGFDQKCAFLGDHRTEPPTPEATTAMVGLLAFLADRSGIDTQPGATTSFESRGSNLHPAGTTVTTPTIAGHRSMSRTECPGDAALALVHDRFPADVTARRQPTSSTTAGAPDTTSAPSSTGPSTSGATTEPAAAEAASPPPSPAGDDPLVPLPAVGAAGGIGAVLVGAALVIRGRRHR